MSAAQAAIGRSCFSGCAGFSKPFDWDRKLRGPVEPRFEVVTLYFQLTYRKGVEDATRELSGNEQAVAVT